VADHGVPEGLSGAGLELVFAALANQDRLVLMGLLLRAVEDGSHSRPSISMLASQAELSRFSASRHLAILRQAGLVEVDHVGHRALHQLNAKRLEAIEDWLYPFIVAGTNGNRQREELAP
jgi:DNA-binding transcriptional ArsR family regulator